MPRSAGRAARAAGAGTSGRPGGLAARAASAETEVAGAESAAQAGVAANRSTDDEVIAEALMFGSQATSHGYTGRGTLTQAAAASGAEASWRRSWFGADEAAAEEPAAPEAGAGCQGHRRSPAAASN